MNQEQHAFSRSEILLSTAPVGKLFLRYAIPGVMGLLFYGLQTIIDGIVVGNFVNSDALAGVNIILPCYSAISVLAIMIGIGSQTVVSIGFGENQYQKSKDAMTTGFLTILAISLLLAVLLYLFTDKIALMLGADDRLLPYAVSYMRGLTAFIPTLLIMFYSDYMLKAMGHPRFAMMIMTMTVLINLALSLFLVIKCQMGTFGVGLATGCSFTIGAIVSGFITFNKKQPISMLAGSFRKQLLGEMLYNGSSEGVSELAIGVSIMIMNLTLMYYAGPEGVAAFTAINYTYFVGTTIFLGISDGIIPIISFNHGAQNKDRVQKVFRIAFCTNFFIGIALFTILQNYGINIVSLFFSGNEETVIRIATQGVTIYAFAFLMSGFNILSSGFFTAIANAKLSVIISALRGLIFVALGLLCFPPLFQLIGIWMTIPVAELLTLMIALGLLLQNRYKVIHYFFIKFRS